MKITIEIPAECYGEYFDEDDNLVVQEPPVGDRAKREKLLDRSFDEWECFWSEMAALVANALLDRTPGYTHPEMHKVEERHKSMCTKHLDKCLEIWSPLTKLNNLQADVETENSRLVVFFMKVIWLIINSVNVL